MNTPTDTIDSGRLSVLFAVMLVTASGNTAMHSLLPTIGSQLNIPDVWVSLAFSWSALFWVYTAPKWARMSDRRGRKKLMHLGLVGFSASMLLSGIVLYLGLIGVLAAFWTFVVFGLLRTLYGGLGSAAPPAVQAYVASRTHGADRTKALSLVASSFGLGTVVGPAAAPYLMMPGLGLSSPLFVFGAIGVLVMVALALALPDDDPSFEARGVVMREPYSSAPSSIALLRDSTTEHDQRSTPTASVDTVDAQRHQAGDEPHAPVSELAWSDERIRPWLIVGLGGGHAHAMVLGVIGFLVMDRIGLRADPAQAVEMIGIVLMAGAVATLLAQWGLIPLLSLQPRTLVVWGLVLAALGSAMISYSDGLLDIVLGFSICSLGFGLFRPGFTAGASLAVEQHEQGAIAGMVSGVTGATFVGAPALSVWLYSQMAVLPFWVIIALCLAMLPWSIAVRLR